LNHSPLHFLFDLVTQGLAVLFPRSVSNARIDAAGDNHIVRQVLDGSRANSARVQ
jgi:hypothetical protein